MTEPRRSTRARAREEAAAPALETPSEKAAKGSKSTLKRKRTSTAAKDSTPGTPVGEAAPQGSRATLPLRIAEGQPLPTLPAPQPLDLPAGEWQKIQQSGVLSASLQRSRAVWVSGVNFRTFHKKHTMPKKLADRTEADKAARARQKEVEKNFPQSAPAPASTPAPDPVIHMLAARAGTDPELKAVMKIVAAGHATKAQLEFFQTHINELTEILEKNKKAKGPMPTPSKAAAPSPQPPPKPASTPTAPKPFSPAPPHTQYAPPPQSRPPQPNPYPPNNYSHPPHYQQPPPHYAAPPPPRITYRPLTFEFVEGNGDRFYFPSYSFMEWLPNGSGAKFSFLVTKLKPKPEEVAKPPSTPSTPAPPQTPAPADASTPGMANPPFPPTPGGPTATPTPVPAPSYVAPPRIEDFDERNDIQDVAFYQPVTVLILTDEHDVKNALPRAIRPPSVVDKYMEQVFDSCKRADETYLAFRLPRDRTTEPDAAVRSAEATPARATPAADKAGGVGGADAGGEKRRSVAGRRKGLV
ncbi:hypothetical protein EJ07DRAFT_93542 [Lizonia empirigonia]|nr:hypothetical protein EJ07DRAFT_93542 [Lizonia empirigonia]